MSDEVYDNKVTIRDVREIMCERNRKRGDVREEMYETGSIRRDVSGGMYDKKDTIRDVREVMCEKDCKRENVPEKMYETRCTRRDVREVMCKRDCKRGDLREGIYDKACTIQSTGTAGELCTPSSRDTNPVEQGIFVKE